jgi:hypothetical protein
VKLKPLSEFSFGHRIALTVVIILIILFAIAIYGFLTGAWEPQESSIEYRLAALEKTTMLGTGPLTLNQQLERLAQASAQTQPDPYAGIVPDTHLLALDRAALEEAYRLRLIRLFDVWLSSNQAQDATNFVNGLKIARRGYNIAAEALAKRESEIKRQEQK